MRPSSLGGGRILRRTLSIRLSVRPVIVAIGNVFSTTASVTSRHLANYNDKHVLFGTHRGPHIVRPSRPHKLVITVNFPFSFLGSCQSCFQLPLSESRKQRA